MMMDVMARLGPRLLCGDVPKVRDACTTSVPVRRASVCAQHHSCRRAVTAYRLEAVCVCVCVSVEKVSYHARLSFGFLFNRQHGCSLSCVHSVSLCILYKFRVLLEHRVGVRFLTSWSLLAFYGSEC